jgi:enoyl-CoA hydratase/carnithine racemase
MSVETAFYIIGIALAVAAVLISFVGLRFEKFPANRGVLLAGVTVFVVLVGGATTFAWISAEDEQEHRETELAEDVAANAPLSVRGNKRVIRELLAAEGPLDEAVERELIELREASFHSEDMREGIRAFGQKRPARWKGR